MERLSHSHYSFYRLEKFDIDAAKLERVLEENRVDAAAMEQLTLSTAVVNVYGYCGASLITEFVGASLENLIHAREMPNNPFVSDIQPAKKLSIALDIATGVATMHNINGRPGFSSNDLHIGNIFFDSQMRPKLNDFNLALFLMTRPNETGVMCHSVRREGMVDAGWRPPEEYLDVTDTSISVISSNSAEDETPAVRVWPDKVDVFALGSIMYTLLVGYDPWWESGEEEHEAAQRSVAPVGES
jgi:serine/threonine protein kinase